MIILICKKTVLAVILPFLGLLQVSCNSLPDRTDDQGHLAHADQVLAEAISGLTDRDDLNVVITRRVEHVNENNGDAPAEVGPQVDRHHLLTGPDGILRLEYLGFQKLQRNSKTLAEGGGPSPPTRTRQIMEELTLRAPLVLMDGSGMFIAYQESGTYRRIPDITSRKQCLEHLQTMRDASAIPTRLLGLHLLSFHPENASIAVADVVDEGVVTIESARTRRFTFERLRYHDQSDGTVELTRSDRSSRISIWIEESPFPRPLRIEYSIGPPESAPTNVFSSVAASGHEPDEVVERIRKIEQFFSQATQQITTTFEYHEPDERLRSRIKRDLADLEEVDPSEESDSEDDGQDDISALLNQSAPSLDAKDLNGDETNLTWSDSSITILDFWATWCGPCIRAMPDLIEVQQEYADRGVRLYAVNVGESAEHVRSFIKEREWEVDVLLDNDHETAQAFSVQAFPTTIIIDEEGVIRAVHQGYSPELRSILRDELDAILRDSSSESNR